MTIVERDVECSGVRGRVTIVRVRGYILCVDAMLPLVVLMIVAPE